MRAQDSQYTKVEGTNAQPEILSRQSLSVPFYLPCDRSGASVLAFPCPDVSPVFCLDFLDFLEEIEDFGLQPVASFSPGQNFLRLLSGYLRVPAQKITCDR